MSPRELWNWVVTSSSDPTKTSLAILGILTLLAPKVLSFLTVVCTLHILCVAVDADWFNTAIAFIVKAVEIGLYLVGGIMTLWGLGRKIKLGQWSHPAA